jgi:hypothetical protein
MPVLPVLGAVAGALARAGILRGTAGRLLGGGARKVLTGPIASSIPVAIGSGARGKILRAGGAVAAATGASMIGTGLAGKFFGGERKRYRRMNTGNVKALNRAIRRVEGFQKLVKRSFSCTDLKPRKRSRSCR